MDLLQTVRKEGSRLVQDFLSPNYFSLTTLSGGRGDFKWDDVKNDVHRENYLGHSLMARKFLNQSL